LIELSPKGSNRNARPTNPRTIPRYADTSRRWPNPTRSKSAIQIGIVPTRSAATPADGLLCPREGSVAGDERRPPKTNAAAIWERRCGLRVSPRGRAMASRIPPATRCLSAMARNGGRSRTTIASAMNVEPQTTYTVTSASQTLTP
jgi:hypothetical protein